MEKDFNVLTEPWLDVVTLDGKHQVVSVEEAIRNSHQIKTLCPDYKWVMQEYAVYRFLMGLTLDIYRFNNNTWNETIKKGQFNPEDLDRYKELYQNRFYLFDDEHPFLQRALEDGDEFEIKTVLDLSPYELTGNNCMFGNMDLDVPHTEKETSGRLRPCSVSEYTSLLLARHVLRLFSGRGTTSTLNTNGKDIRIIVCGKTLFETIMCSMPKDLPGSISYETSVPMWRRDEYWPNLAEMAARQDSCLSYLFFPASFVSPDKDGFDGEHVWTYKCLKLTTTDYLKKMGYIKATDTLIQEIALKKDPHICASNEKEFNTKHFPYQYMYGETGLEHISLLYGGFLGKVKGLDKIKSNRRIEKDGLYLRIYCHRLFTKTEKRPDQEVMVYPLSNSFLSDSNQDFMRDIAGTLLFLKMAVREAFEVLIKKGTFSESVKKKIATVDKPYIEHGFSLWCSTACIEAVLNRISRLQDDEDIPEAERIAIRKKVYAGGMAYIDNIVDQLTATSSNTFNRLVIKKEISNAIQSLIKEKKNDTSKDF